MKASPSDRMFSAVIYLVLALIVLVVVYPLYFVLIASISSPDLVLSGHITLLPQELTVRGYTKLLDNAEILRGYGNTILYTTLGTAINVALTVAAAYPLSRRDLAGRHWIMGMMVFTMFFSGGLIPTYLLVKQLGLLNSMWAMLLPSAVSVWNIVLMRTFFQNGVPFELQEAATIDGSSPMRTLWSIVLPLSAPILAVMVLFYSVGHWNAYFHALIFLSDRELYPLQLILREILVQGEMKDMVDVADGSLTDTLLDAESIKYAIVIVANLPVLLLYPLLQKYFAKGVLVGALKG
ncbi:putative aldouronate transport system permease protein [Paenibacillus sp. UNCCL117]|uniref:carbohydrate ABC transporter permease n=1 Tax=unclassified Paenibacillus TaxID=185978 RepID=UPI000882791B|nr:MULTISPECIES: carbohydrate ABC transporter permease [unclassified Paenibacillus]SDD89380.1 carbohydrate ABC transporter membrane protein 2, CUT1 family [Paenibacillus sp. cl123]SFW44183.1 putative aldouronate transport system permease protein [Paenibacillus sp. UNCCL117]